MYSIEEQLDVVLEMNDLEPVPEDREALLKALASSREQAALVYAVADARYEEPDLIFSARL